MLTRAFSGAVIGIGAVVVEVEVNIGPGDPHFRVVGLPDTAVKESIDRVWTAIGNAAYRPKTGLITINLAPADIKKEGPVYDLPIALALLEAGETEKLPLLAKIGVIGELALSSEVRRVKGALPVALAMRKAGFKGLIVPEANAEEVAMVEGIDIYPVTNLRDAADILSGRKQPPPFTVDAAARFAAEQAIVQDDFSDVKGQYATKRALEIAVAGGHNILMIGSPGSGKTMLARSLPGILPPMTLEESLEATAIHSVAGTLKSHQALVARRPFRAPHHTISDAGMLGGGTRPVPGEVSLAHRGVLFLDELPEFHRNVLEVLRQPLEDGFVTIARAASTVTYPSNFMLVAAMNPCPCGFAGDPKRECRCSAHRIQAYRAKISGPLLDRIDIHIEVPAVNYESLRTTAPGESSATIRQRIVACRAIQAARFADTSGIHTNAAMTSRQVQTFCVLEPDAAQTLQMAMNELNFTARAYDRILKVARTLADLEASETITRDHILEVIQYRTLDRNLWV